LDGVLESVDLREAIQQSHVQTDGVAGDRCQLVHVDLIADAHRDDCNVGRVDVCRCGYRLLGVARPSVGHDYCDPRVTLLDRASAVRFREGVEEIRQCQLSVGSAGPEWHAVDGGKYILLVGVRVEVELTLYLGATTRTNM